MGWFPQQYALEFNVVKSILALIAMILLIVHMSEIWSHTNSRARRGRYLILLGYAMVTFYESLDYIYVGAEVRLYNVIRFILVASLIPVTIMSMREWRDSRTLD